MSNLKIGIVGTGNVASQSYLPYLSQETDASLGYFNRTRDKAVACAVQFGGTAFDTLDALMAWQPDAVMILTHETQRLEATQAVLRYRPKRIFFEKPLVAAQGQANVSEQDFLDARQLMTQADAIGCETAMVFNYRFFEHSLLAKRIVEERGFGAVRNISGLVHYACWSHCIDLVHFFAGPIAEISALQGDTPHTQGNFRAKDVTVAFRTAHDATGTLIGTAALAWTFPLYELTINYEHGRIRMQDLDGEMTVMDAHGLEVQSYRIASDRSRWNQYNDSFKKSLQAYVHTVRKGKPPPVLGRFGLLELQVEAAIKRSIRARAPILLDEHSSSNGTA